MVIGPIGGLKEVISLKDGKSKRRIGLGVRRSNLVRLIGDQLERAKLFGFSRAAIALDRRFWVVGIFSNYIIINLISVQRNGLTRGMADTTSRLTYVTGAISAASRKGSDFRVIINFEADA